MVNGILPLWKPKGYTSHDCVMRVRRLFKMKKVGHTGTLDPDVEGVLPICLGDATKIIPYLEGEKVYVAHLKLGQATETEDSSGDIIEEAHVDRRFSHDEMEDVLQEFTGPILQIPPMYSAVKVKGKRLYEYARKNIAVERPARQVTIHNITQLDDPSLQLAEDEYCFRVACSKGTYIRTLCVDIGRKLGYPAHMSYLERHESDSFTKEDTVTFAEIEQAVEEEKEAELLLPMERSLTHLQSFNVDVEMKKRISFGQKLKLNHDQLKTVPFLMLDKGKLLAIYKPDDHNDYVRPVRVFNAKQSEGEQR